ncbi:MAG: hypothetical protein OXD46_00055 [Chloroflexi bacterium]|nr:hypothetical protein [Chloroflexota bacterium]
MPTATPTRTPVPTNTPTTPPSPTHRPTATNTPTASPTNTTTPSPTKTSTPVPSATPTHTPLPKPTNTPTPSPTPVPTAEELAEAHLSEIIPWFKNPPDGFHRETASIVTDFWLQDSEFGEMVASLSWMDDSLTSDEWHIVTILRDIASEDLNLAKAAITLPWLADSVTWYETQMLAGLGQIAFQDLNLANMVVTLPWVRDGVTSDDEAPILLFLSDIVSVDLQLVNEILAPAWVQGHWDRHLYSNLLISIGSIASQGTDALSQLTTQPWFADGLNEKEAVLVVTLAGVYGESSLYQDLLKAHHTQTMTVSLPLAGDVNIWVIQPDPFPPDEDLLTIIENTARIMEGFLEVPFPTTDIILLVANQSYGVGGLHAGSHMRLVRRDSYDGQEVEVEYIPHETAHYYFSANSTGPRWLTEGAAEYFQAYVNDLKGVKDLKDHRIEVSRETNSVCIDGYDEFENIRHYVYVSDYKGGCHYDMGENLLHGLFETMGDEAMRAALRDLILLELVKDAELDEHEVENRIYLTLLEHTPPEKRDKFRNLYLSLHGGPYQDPEADRADDHGDEASTASDIQVRDVVEGALDYMWDFDYFRFQAEEGPAYWINVTHDTLRSSSISVYGRDGQTEQRWMLRERGSNGPRMLWETQNSGEHYFAVQNFGGKTGQYTFTITPLVSTQDDHGDTPATATDIPVNGIVNGTIDHSGDVDVFRFHVMDGRSYGVVFTLETLEEGSLRLYSRESFYPLYLRGITRLDLTNSWWGAAASGDHYYVVAGYDGKKGAYSLVTSGGDQ